VGAVGLGCMGMSWAYEPDPAHPRDEAQSVAVIQRALDLGVTLIDTSDMYGPFTNEELVGRALRGRRDEAVLATKGGLVVGEAAPGGDAHSAYGINRVGTPEHLRGAIDASLRRLGVDHVDLYQLHRVDPDVPIEESWGAMAEMITAGKTRALGLSEVSVAELERATWVLAQGEHVVPIPGTRRVERLEENAGAAWLTLDAEALAQLDAIPAPAGARY
jgi:aryl-alcohol dehydrogenase-like predicted oxidoreductase